MLTILTILHVLVCIFLIFVVLLQQAQNADWSGAFGGGGTQTAFGQRGAGTLLSKATTVSAVIFMITSMALTIMITRPGGNSVVREGAKQNQSQQQQQPQPAQQAPAQPQQQQSAPAPATPGTPEKK
ncbi:MAG TPA: preprotein translocase subunit SecG [Terriglobia bacterium]|jgi:preprotein translocase subunit SecG